MPVRRSNRLAVTVGGLGGVISLGQFAANLGLGPSSLVYLGSGLLLLLAVLGELVPGWRALTSRALLVAGALVVVQVVRMLMLGQAFAAAGGPVPTGFTANVAVTGVLALAALGVGTAMLLASRSGANANPTA